MPTNRIQLQDALQKPYDRLYFAKSVLKEIFGTSFSLFSSLIKPTVEPSLSEFAVIDSIGIYGKVSLEDGTEITCYEIIIKPNVRIEYNKVAIQHYVRKLLTIGQAALINFVSPTNKNVWRLTLVAKDSKITKKGIEEKSTYAQRYTYLLGPSETCKTAAERFELLSIETKINLESLIKSFSVEKLSKTFFDEYTIHYERFIDYLNKSNFKKSVFKGNEKAIRDFTKKLLGRIVFLYFVQKKGWLGASNIDYKDGIPDFMIQLFKQSGGNDSFYPNWLSRLFFDTLNNERENDDFKMPDGKKVKIPFLNGGLFDKEEHDDKVITIKSELFHNSDNEDDYKCRGFFDFLNAYNFTIYEDGPDEKTVAVDPEMLGHIFENLLEDNKDKGAYYTPKEIVHYMCQETLIEYLTTHLSKEYKIYQQIGREQTEFFGNESSEGQLKLLEEIADQTLNHEDVSTLIKTKDISSLTKEQLKRIDQLLDFVKICDPAIGSGAFPMGLLLEIYSIKESIAYETGKDWKPAEVKEQIIQNSIYGVDIEKGAVDIARLRFWLSLVVDEEKPKPLPNLDYKIVVGNSLVNKFDDEVIEIAWERKSSHGKADEYVQNVQRLLKEVVGKQKEYFKPENTNKQRIAEEIKNLKIDLLINQLLFNRFNYHNKNSEVIDSGFGLTSAEMKKNTEIQLTLANYDKLINKLQKLRKKTELQFYHFDWKLDFPEILNPHLTTHIGFDIVIGNPPYIQLQKESGKLAKIYEKQNFETFKRTGDIYALFYEKGNHLLKDNGVLCLITSNKWMRAGYGDLLRKYLAEKTNPLLLIDFAGQKIFETATVDTNILMFRKDKYSISTQSCVVKNDYKNNLSEYVKEKSSLAKFSNKSSWVILNTIEKSIKEKIERIGTPLKDWDIQINYGIKTGYNEAFIIDGIRKEELIRQDPKSAEIIRPILRGRDIKRYGYDFADLWLINTHNGIKEKDVSPIEINNYPAIKKHLDKYYFEIEKRVDRGVTPYNLRNCAYMEDFFRPKIMYPNMTKFLPFYYDEKEFFQNDKSFMITGKNIAYLTAFLNSSLFKFCFIDNFPELQGGTRELRKIFFDKIPVMQIQDELNIKFKELILSVQEAKIKQESSHSVEIEIDELIFKIYSLSNVERRKIGFIEIK